VKDRRRVVVSDGDLESCEEFGGEVGRLGGDRSLEVVGRLFEEDALFGSVAERSELDEVKNLDQGEL
jgi:hypothetical protein